MNKEQKRKKLQRLNNLGVAFQKKGKVVEELSGELLKDLDEEEDEEEPKISVGIERREILNRANKDWHSLYDRPLQFFMDLPIEYGLDFVRVNATKNINLLLQYLQFMYKHNITVELTLMDHDENGKEYDFFGDPATVIAETSYFENIIYDPVNEPYSEEQVNKLIQICNALHQLGLKTIAGGYGTGGKKWSDRFDPVNNNNTMISIHRSYEDKEDVKATVKPYKKKNGTTFKPSAWDESLRLTPFAWAERCHWFRKEGVTMFNYYGTRSQKLFPDLEHEDPYPWRAYYEMAQTLRKTLNAE